MSIAVAEKLTWDERISALTPAHQKLLGSLIDEFAKIDNAQPAESAKYSKEWYIAEIQKGLDSADRGEVRDFDEVTEEILAKLGL